MLLIRKINQDEVDLLFDKGCFSKKEKQRLDQMQNVNNNYLSFGVFKEESIIGMASFFNNNIGFENLNAFELKAMFVKNKYQKEWVGTHLLMHAEAFLKNIKSALVWCNADSDFIQLCKNNGYCFKESNQVSNEQLLFKIL